MISSLRGKLISADTDYLVVECSGVGFKCFVTKNTLYSLPDFGSEIFLYTYLSVKEDALDLYGFKSSSELSSFKLITSVNGVGAKIGIALLSQFEPERLMFLIAANDFKSLTAATGVGSKLAQRIVLELKDKTGSIITDNTSVSSNIGNVKSSSNTSEAVEALTALGFSAGDSALAVGKLDPNLSTDVLIKEALKILSRLV